MIFTNHRIKALVVAGIALFALTSCSASSADATGTWGEEADGQPHLVLEEGGKLSGTDGCNRLSGGWEQDGEVIIFGEVAMTLMACPDVDTWLMDLDTARIDGDALLVSDASGAEIGSLAKTARQ
ncbi:META domain-containing protein [Leucobacter aridicollis]|uniref:META domain-containing protein n=1 Tax=Leucobacter aridicollis TaxID=283878 RepID=UPI0021053996|nr:META domain-containing protein [Leucobacter aridicollis]UTX52092.1 META domain-containing protein [Leucobacter aridicollis]